MNYKYSDLVVIPKNALNSLLLKDRKHSSEVIVTDKEVVSLLSQAKPLQLIIEHAFDTGSEWSVEAGEKLNKSKQQFILKGLEL